MQFEAVRVGWSETASGGEADEVAECSEIFDGIGGGGQVGDVNGGEIWRPESVRRRKEMVPALVDSFLSDM